MPQIKIDNILGGHAPTTHFATASQFRASLGIDPAQPINDTDTAYSTIASGLIRPTASEKFSGSVIEAAPMWIKANPKNNLVYVMDAKGSTYTISDDMTTVTALGDRGWLTGSIGNGCEYYDNYMYFAKGTDIVRYGPLDGTPSFALDANGSYWDTTLAMVALGNTAVYPRTYKNKLQLPNHTLHRHSDGILYVADVVDNQGVIHTIQTKKTTVEGDTNNGSYYLKLMLGYGLYPTCMESYGSDVAIGLFEGKPNISGTDVKLRQTKAKICFWNGTASPTLPTDTLGGFQKMTWVEFPDSMITAMKNVNGVLYVVSGNHQAQGFRITRFVGGYSFEEIFYSETGEPCLPGAIDAVLNRCVFGSFTTVPESDGCVYGIGLQKNALSQTGIFNVMRATGGTSSTCVTAVAFVDSPDINFYAPIIGWTQAGDGSTGATHGLDKQDVRYDYAPSVFWSSVFRVGSRFKINKIHIPLAQAVATNMVVTPTLYFDDGVASLALEQISTTKFSGLRDAVIRPSGATGYHNFWLELKWTGSALCTVNLPITIDFDVLDE